MRAATPGMPSWTISSGGVRPSKPSSFVRRRTAVIAIAAATPRAAPAAIVAPGTTQLVSPAPVGKRTPAGRDYSCPHDRDEGRCRQASLRRARSADDGGRALAVHRPPGLRPQLVLRGRDGV